MATHNAMLQVFFVLSSLLWATASATQVRMSVHLGSGSHEKAKLSLKVGLMIALGCGLLVAAFFLAAGQNIALLYSKDAPQVRKLTGEIAYLVGTGYLFLTLFYISMACLNAQARVGYVVVAFVVGAWGVAVPMSYVLAFQVSFTKGLIGLWLGLCCGYFVLTLIACYGVYTSDWEAITKSAVERSREQASLVAEDVTQQNADVFLREPLVQNAAS
jgi:Na+-driven multidrug efflux pump